MPDRVGNGETDLMIPVAPGVAVVAVMDIAGMTVSVYPIVRLLSALLNRGSALGTQNALTPRIFGDEGVMNDDIGAGHTLVTAQDADKLSMIPQTPHDGTSAFPPPTSGDASPGRRMA